MARVKTKTRNRGGTKTYPCTAGCGKPIEPGETYFTWSRRFGRTGRTYYRHTKCGYPRPTELTSRKTAQVEEAVIDAKEQVSNWSPDLESPDTDALTSALSDAAQSARDVGEEYESNADAMPENLQYGSQAEAMRDVARELEDWATELEGWSPSEDEPVFDADADKQAKEDIFQEWVEKIRGEADEALDESIPEYQG